MCTIDDIAEEFGVSKSTVRVYLSDSSTMNFPRAISIREYAKRMGYEPTNHKYKFNNKNCICCGKTFTPTNAKQRYCSECGINARAEYMRAKDKMRWEKKRAEGYWFNGNYRTKTEETARMKQLRAEGFSNAEIAKKIGRSLNTVWRAIGAQPEDMTKQNIALGPKIRAQKNAARKQYLINKPIIEYNRKVAEAEKVQAQLDELKKDLSIKKVAAEKSARAKVKCPSFSLETTTIAG